MSSDDVKSFIDEMVTFLQAIDRVIPNRVDAELISFLESAQQHEWIIDLLVKVIGNKVK